MSKKQKSSWQELKEEKYLFISLAWIWRACLLAVIGIVFLSFWSDGDLTKTRNFILIVAALLAFPLALHRMIIADNQLKATEKQMKQTEEENKRLREDAQIQKREDNFENLQRDLSSGNKSQQLRAIDQLWKLARSYAQDYHCHYHLRVMHSLSDFLERTKHINPDADVAIMVLKILTNLDNRYEKTRGQEEEEILDNYNISLQSLEIREIDLSEANFSRFTLKNVAFIGVNLEKAVFNWAMLKSVRFSRSYLTGANFDNAFLQDISFAKKTDITGASWKNISIPVPNTINFENNADEAIVMQNTKIKSKDEWLKESRKKFGWG